MSRFFALLLCYAMAALANAADYEMEQWYREFITQIARENYRAVVDRIHPSGLIVGDFYIPKDEVVKELNNPLSEKRKHLDTPFTVHKKKMCRDYGTAFVSPKIFVSMTHEKYSVSIQTDFEPHFLVSAHADVKIDNNVLCTLRLFPISVERMNGHLYSMGIPE